MIITLPSFSLVVLVGISGSGKSSFAARWFSPTEVISSDRLRAMITDDEANQSSSSAAFDILHRLANYRLGHGRLTVIDATSTRKPARLELTRLAQSHNRPAVALVLNPPLEVCLSRNSQRSGRVTPEEVVKRQSQQLIKSLETIETEGFSQVHVLNAQEIDLAKIERI
ncbi:MAG: AAA family ATPase [Deltaproteobacteria bacterium]|jgi:protein phosphatase|nr:AAA family ATPase [Deltaproteobacteria bacterium]